MSHVLAALEPAKVFEYFYQITRVPRPSKKEERIREYVIGVAKSLGREYAEDAAGNIVIRKPASQGHETSPVVIVQGHLDMVCEKTAGHPFDFDNDPIDVRVDGDYIKANNTTLGADNGIAVAAMLALLEDSSLSHGPLEFLFTIDEETGLTGAHKLDPRLVKGRYLLNLDSEEEGTLFVGCSGGKDILMTVPVGWKEKKKDGWALLEAKVEGCTGGHSGLDIHLGRANAIKVLARVLWNLNDEFGIRLCEIQGGTKRNAIPRDAVAQFLIVRDDVQAARKKIQSMQKTVKGLHKDTDPGLKISCKELKVEKMLSMKSRQSEILLDLLNALPSGVVSMSRDIPGLVETSVNLATVETTKTGVLIGSSHRSSVEDEKMALVNSVFSIGRLAGAEAEETDGYPGWKPNLQSKSLQVAKEVFREVYGKEPLITAIHAGLECGIIGEKFGDMDMVSFGPTIRNAHSPDECLHIPSVGPFYDAVKKVLERLIHMP